RAAGARQARTCGRGFPARRAAGRRHLGGGTQGREREKAGWGAAVHRRQRRDCFLSFEHVQPETPILRSFPRKRESRAENRNVSVFCPWVPAFAGTSG